MKRRKKEQKTKQKKQKTKHKELDLFIFNKTEDFGITQNKHKTKRNIPHIKYCNSNLWNLTGRKYVPQLQPTK